MLRIRHFTNLTQARAGFVVFVRAFNHSNLEPRAILLQHFRAVQSYHNGSAVRKRKCKQASDG